MTRHITCPLTQQRSNLASRQRHQLSLVSRSEYHLQANPCYPRPACWTGTPNDRDIQSMRWMLDQTEGDHVTPNYARSQTISITGSGYTLGPTQSNTKKVSCRNYVPSAWTNWYSLGGPSATPSFPAPPSGSFSDQPSDNAAMLEALSVSNPAFSKNDVLLPVSILELRELPKMVWDRLNKRKQTNSAVEWNFGWAPLISDVRKLFKFPDTMERRLTTMRGMAKGASNRQVTVYRGHASQVYGERTVESAWYPLYAIASSRLSVKWKREIRASVSWESTLPPNLGDADYARIAARLALGLDPSQIIQGAWELLPWSWLTDYFYNVSDLIAANNYSVGRPSRTSLSQVDECIATEEVTAGPVKSGRPFITRFRKWERRPFTGTALPDLEMPILSASQAVTLASIAFGKGR